MTNDAYWGASGSRAYGIAVVFDRQILAGAAQLAVIDADDDQRRNQPALDEPCRRLGDAPGDAGIRARRVEEVLSVVQ